jgi:PleD family two-component response regulator
VTISAGVCDLVSAGDAAEMVRLADRMLYRAKAEGRDAVCRHAVEGLAHTA